MFTQLFLCVRKNIPNQGKIRKIGKVNCLFKFKSKKKNETQDPSKCLFAGPRIKNQLRQKISSDQEPIYWKTKINFMSQRKIHQDLQQHDPRYV